MIRSTSGINGKIVNGDYGKVEKWFCMKNESKVGAIASMEAL